MATADTNQDPPDEAAKITREELIGLFGDHLPMAAVALITEPFPHPTITETRQALRQMAASLHAAGATSASDLITPEAIEMMAEHLLEEDYSSSGWTWPTHDGDDGYRGGGYVSIAPPDVRAELREKARRVLIRSKQISKRVALASPTVAPESVRSELASDLYGHWVEPAPGYGHMWNPGLQSLGNTSVVLDASPSVRADDDEAAEIVAGAYYDAMMGQVPHTHGWAGKPESFKRKVRDRMAGALRKAGLLAPTPPASAGDVEAILKAACKTWEHYAGEPPDDGSPLSGVFVAGMVYTERLLAKLLDVTHYEGGDGSEDFDGDATQSLRNILAGAGLWDADENRATAPAAPEPTSGT